MLILLVSRTVNFFKLVMPLSTLALNVSMQVCWINRERKRKREREREREEEEEEEEEEEGRGNLASSSLPLLPHPVASSDLPSFL